MAGDDCARLLDLGVNALIVSNHGRPARFTPATIDVLAEVVDAVGDHAEVFIDRGIRRGSDVANHLRSELAPA